jgi:TolB-like protein/DNA-binding winged helix-turn-helix (wHTH) protein/Tfp pilus assembly protein PilF
MENRVYKFAGFELNVADGELRNAGKIVRLQEKPLRLLCALLENPQRLITREQLRDRMWDSRTVVNFEQGINVAIKKVRDALADPVDNPKIIETLPKKGYRLAVPVEVLSDSGVADGQPGVAEPAPVSARAEADPLVRRERTIGRYLPGLAAVGVLCLAGFAFFGSDTGHRGGARISSLAVLPLQNLSPDPGQEYFADGITEEVTTYLAETLPLRVISHTSAQRFRKTDQSIAQIARDLGVDAILEGSVARSGNRVSVVVQLIDAREDRHIWAQKFDRRTDDVLTMESELSRAIAGQIGGRLGAVQSALARAPTVDPQAYDRYLMGQYHLQRRTASDLAKAEQYFRQALERDPNYAPAYAGVASVYALLPSYGPESPLVSLAKATTAARQALAIDDHLAEAHATLALIALYRIPDWVTSDTEFRRAIEIDPNYATAHHWFAYQRYCANRPDEALKEITLARELDPLSAITNADEGHFLYAMRRFEEARLRLKRAIDLAPELGQPHESLALVELETGHPQIALQEARAGLALDPANPRTMAEAGYVLAMTGQPVEARRLLSELKILAGRGSSPLFPSMVQIGLGQRAQAIQSLGSQIESRMPGIHQWHAFDGIGANAEPPKLVDALS